MEENITIEPNECSIRIKKSEILPSGECINDYELEIKGNTLEEVRKHYNEIIIKEEKK